MLIWLKKMRAAQVVSPWNSRLSGGLSPGMISDREFDIDYHFRRSALPQAGGRARAGKNGFSFAQQSTGPKSASLGVPFD